NETVVVHNVSTNGLMNRSRSPSDQAQSPLARYPQMQGELLKFQNTKILWRPAHLIRDRRVSLPYVTYSRRHIFNQTDEHIDAAINLKVSTHGILFAHILLSKFLRIKSISPLVKSFTIFRIERLRTSHRTVKTHRARPRRNIIKRCARQRPRNH